MELNNKTYGQNDKDVFCKDIRSGLKACKAGYLFAMTTEEIIFCKSDPAEYDEEKLFRLGLDIRIFNLEGERKWFRSGIGRDYRYRERMDDENVIADKLHYWDEYHFLDIDDAKTEKKNIFVQKGMVYATGGGTYPLPIEKYKDAKIKIRNYLGEDPDTGELYVEDWRLVALKEGE